MIEEFNNDTLNMITADELLSKYVDVYTKITDNIPEGLHVDVHFCRGNFVKSRHFTEGSYDLIAVRLLQILRVPILYLEFDTERAEGSRPLEYALIDKKLILGVVSSKYPKLEDSESTVARIYEATRYIAKRNDQSEKETLNQLSVSPQCGFASHSSGDLGRHNG